MLKEINDYKSTREAHGQSILALVDAIQNELLQGLDFDVVCSPGMYGMIVISILNTEGEGEKERREVRRRLQSTNDDEISHTLIDVYNLELTAEYFSEYARMEFKEEEER